MSTGTREVEWQFDTDDLDVAQHTLAHVLGDGPLEGVAIESVATFDQTDDYLDTADATLLRAGISVRLRRRADSGRMEATLKGLDGRQDGDGPRVRFEITEPIEGASPITTLRRSHGPIGERIRSLIGRKRLTTRVTVHSRRSTYRLSRSGEPAGEMVFDDTAITSPQRGDTTHLRRIEIEVPDEATAAMTSFVEAVRTRLNLVPARLTKFETGLVHAGVEIPPARPVGPTTITRNSTIGEVAFAALRRQLAVLVEMEPGTRLGDDIEHLHRMRVACRRMRAAIKLFADSLTTEVTVLNDDVRWLGRQLGPVRDLDVQIEQVDDWIADLDPDQASGLRVVRDLLCDDRRRARRVMVAALDSPRYRDVVARLYDVLAPTDLDSSGSASHLAKKAAPVLIDDRYRRLVRHGRRVDPDGPDSDLHRLRLDAKRLRYALEFLRDALPKGSKKPLRRLTELQDLLGQHQDAAIAIERLHELVETHADDLPATTIFTLGELSERYRAQKLELRKGFPKAWRRVRSCDWERLCS